MTPTQAEAFITKLHGLTDSAGIDYEVDPEALTSGLTKIAAMIARVGEQRADVALELCSAKLRLVNEEANADTMARNGGVGGPGQKVTEQAVKSFVDRHPSCLALNNEIVQYEAAAKRLDGRLRGLSAKKDGLITMANLKMAQLKSFNPEGFVSKL